MRPCPPAAAAISSVTPGAPLSSSRASGPTARSSARSPSYSPAAANSSRRSGGLCDVQGIGFIGELGGDGEGVLGGWGGKCWDNWWAVVEGTSGL